MIKKILVSTITASMMMFLLTACAEDDQTSTAGKTPAIKAPEAVKEKRPVRPTPKKPEPRPQEDFQSAAIMSQAVDFSSAEQMTASLDAIKQDAGEEAASRVKNAIDYLLVYDLSVARNKQKLYQKLNGKTPNEILAMTNR